MTPQVAVIRDEDRSVLFAEFPWLLEDLLVAIPEQLRLAGIAFDSYALNDLSDFDLTSYRVVIVLNAFKLTAEARHQLKAQVCCDGRTVLWLYAAGYATDEGSSLTAMEDLTDFHLHKKPVDYPKIILLNSSMFCNLNSEIEFGFDDPAFDPDSEYSINGLHELTPTFYFDDRRAIPCAFYIDDSLPAMGYKRMPDYTTWYCGVGNIPAVVLREIVRSAGVDV